MSQQAVSLREEVAEVLAYADSLIPSRADAHTSSEAKKVSDACEKLGAALCKRVVEHAAHDKYCAEKHNSSLSFAFSPKPLEVALDKIKRADSQKHSSARSREDSFSSSSGRNVWDKDVKQLFDDLLLCHIYLRDLYGPDFYFPEHRHLAADFDGWSRVLRKAQALYEADKVASAHLKAKKIDVLQILAQKS